MTTAEPTPRAPKPRRSLAEVDPDLAAQWHPTKNGEMTAQMLTAGSNTKVWWQCPDGHDWPATPNNRSGGGNGCPVCSGQRVLAGYNDLAEVDPDLAAQWHPTKNGEMTAQMLTAGSNTKVWWQCPDGHDWPATPNNRSGGGNGCPVCSGQRPLAGHNDLATTHPELAAQWHPTKNGELTAQMVTTGSRKKVWWRCPNGHDWPAVISRRSGSGCPVCATKTVATTSRSVSGTD